MNKDLKARIIDRIFIVVVCAIGFLIAWVLLEVFAPAAQAQELTVRFVPVVPTVPGIEAAPSPTPAYQRGPVVRTAPSAAIIALPQPALANGCQRPAFEVISGPRAGRGCYAQ